MIGTKIKDLLCPLEPKQKCILKRCIYWTPSMRVCAFGSSSAYKGHVLKGKALQRYIDLKRRFKGKDRGYANNAVAEIKEI